MPKKNNEPVTRLADLPGGAYDGRVDIEFATHEGEVVFEVVDFHVPVPGETVTLGSKGKYRVIRRAWEYSDDSYEPYAKVTVRKEAGM